MRANAARVARFAGGVDHVRAVAIAITFHIVLTRGAVATNKSTSSG